VGAGLTAVVLALSGCQQAGVTAVDGSTVQLYEDLNLAYASASPAEVLDLYRPLHPNGKLAVVVLMHGGGFSLGDKSDINDLAASLVEHGYAVANINYRLYPNDQPFPAPVADAKAAVRWLRANAAKYDLDRGRIAALGESAGAYLAEMVGTWGDVMSNADRALGNTNMPSTVSAVVDLYGPVDFLQQDPQIAAEGCGSKADIVHDSATSPESMLLGAQITTVPALVSTANPLSYVGKGRPLPPPFLIEHGTSDCTVPYQQSQELAGGLRAVGAQVTLALVSGAAHGIYFPTGAQLPGIESFLDAHLR
jgi:acetyl esterase/lipase